ncbi:MAG: hypothetical protein AAF533_04495 [Acidobacteriota bacterium]
MRHQLLALISLLLLAWPSSTRSAPEPSLLFENSPLAWPSPWLLRHDSETLTIARDARHDLIGLSLLTAHHDGTVLREDRLFRERHSHVTDALTAQDGSVFLTWRDEWHVPESDLMVVKLDAENRVAWKQSYDAGALERAMKLVEGADGNLFVIGEIPNRRLVVLHLSAADGALLASRVFDLGQSVVTRVAASTPDGGLIIGSTIFPESEESDVYLLRLDASLEREWEHAYGGSGGDSIRDIVTRREGGWLIVGGISRSGLPYDNWVFTVDSLGTIEWQVVMESEQHDFFTTGAQLADGGYWLGGDTRSTRDEDDFGNAWMVGLGPDGSLRWQRAYGVPELYEGVDSVTVLDDGRVVVGAFSQGFPSDWSWLLWLDDHGRPDNVCTDVLPEPREWRRTDLPQRAISSSVIDVPFAASDTPTTLITALSTSQVGCSPEPVEPMPPDEVSPPGALTPLRIDADHVLSWEDRGPSRSDAFNVYRGDLALLPTGLSTACWQEGLFSSTTTDPEIPAPGTGWYYLVVGENTGGDGPLGSDSAGNPRGVLDACP